MEINIIVILPATWADLHVLPREVQGWNVLLSSKILWTRRKNKNWCVQFFGVRSQNFILIFSATA